MVGSDGGDQGGLPSAGELVRITRRLHRHLRVYRRSNSGGYDWDEWDSEATAVVEAELLRKHPERWRRYVHQAQESKHSWKVLQLLVADLAEDSWMELVLDPVQERRRPGQRFGFSPLFEWMLALAVGEIRAPTRKGHDTSVRVWRDLSIFDAVSDLKAVGLSEPIAQKLVAEEVGLGGRERQSDLPEACPRPAEGAPAKEIGPVLFFVVAFRLKACSTDERSRRCKRSSVCRS